MGIFLLLSLGAQIRTRTFPLNIHPKAFHDPLTAWFQPPTGANGRPLADQAVKGLIHCRL